MKKKIFGGLLILSMMLAGCAGKHGNLPDNTGDDTTIQQVTDNNGDPSIGNGNEDIIDSGNINTLNDNDATTNVANGADPATNGSDDDNDTDCSTLATVENWWSIGNVYEDGSVDVIFDDDTTINSNDFTSSTKYVRIIDDIVQGDVAPSILFDIAREYPGYAEGDYDMNVTKDLTLPTQVDEVKIAWTSSDESLITNEGKVTRPHEHSKYVMLTAVLSNGEGEITSRYIVKVARDMYDDVTEDMILGLTDDYGNWEKLEEMGIDLFEYPGWFYYCDEIDQLYFFQIDLDRIFLYDDPNNQIDPHVQCTGDLFEVRPETHHETELAVSSLRTVIYCDDKYELRCDRSFPGMDEECFDFIQYYNGVPTSGMIRIAIAHDPDSVNWFNSRILQIPDGFDTTVKYSADKLKKDYELYNEPELSIDEMDGKFVLIWSAYTKNQTRIIVDAKSGELLEEYSTTIID